MASGGQCVEVRKSADSATWYNASVVDISDDHVRVSFENDVWPSKEVPMSLVRLKPPASEAENFAPQVDDEVEVHLAATEANPSGWSRGKVKTIRSRTFYFVTFAGGSHRSQDIIVERSSLRRPSSSPAFDQQAVIRRTIPVDPGLHAWIRSADSHGCLSNVAAKSSLLSASCTMDKKRAPRVLLVGDEHAVTLGEKLLSQIHFKNQIKMQQFHEYREYYLERIKWYEQWNGGKHKEVFSVDTTFVGRIIGKKGENIQKLRQDYEVEIEVEASPTSWVESVITITGESAEAVKKAREQMEYITESIEIEPDQVGWIVGKGYQNLTEIQTNAGLQYARFDSKTSSIELRGLRQQVEDAKLMVQVHRDYLAVYQDMSKEQRTLAKEFAELDRRGGKKGGGKKGGGRSRGSGWADLNDEEESEGEWDQWAPPPLRGGKGEKGGKGVGKSGVGKGGKARER
mmetsp:Transcript_91144/g.262880  ORF Transcript_91144/g.262880 Transcript_91144/m.262880 type:complete len:457 (+) Transcript_91144:84-1454(+)